MKPKKPKKREITMWAIWNPYFKCFCLFIDTNRNEAWYYLTKSTMQSKKALQKKGYRAVKGKFVWEEK